MIEELSNGIRVHNISNFNLLDTLDCGQCFRWSTEDNIVFTGTVNAKTINASIVDDILFLENTSLTDYNNIWKDYFDLDRDYGKIRESLSSVHPILKEASSTYSGIRILKQDSFEALCSFIISQNNNIPRIKGIIDKLCKNFGEFNGVEYVFPTAQILAKQSVESLDIIKSGFRAKYLIDAATKVANNEIDLDQIKTMPLEEAKNELMKIKGVGPKVADCVLLYGMNRLSVFPLDVWMKRAMEILFPKLTPEDFGEYAGIAQQYIFHYSRMNPNLFK